MFYNFFKKLYLISLVCITSSAINSFHVYHYLDVQEYIQSYKDDGITIPMTAQGLADVIVDLYSYNPEEYENFYETISYFVQNGCDLSGRINAFKLTGIRIDQNDQSLKNISLLEVFITSGFIVKALFENGFVMETTEEFKMLSRITEFYKCLVTSEWINIFILNHLKLSTKQIFDHCSKASQEKYLKSFPEFKHLVL